MRWEIYTITIGKIRRSETPAKLFPLPSIRKANKISDELPAGVDGGGAMPNIPRWKRHMRERNEIILKTLDENGFGRDLAIANNDAIAEVHNHSVPGIGCPRWRGE